MLELDQIGRLGFGGYRVSDESWEHHAALVRALELGCNLLDTAASYGHGASERLFGRVLQERPEFDAFVVTKAGYFEPESLAWLESTPSQAAVRKEICRLSDGALHSIHPDFLLRQLHASRGRLQRSSVDALLLHNPEHYFDQIATQGSEDEYYDRVRKAFECLEGEVEKGNIRYYGVSSNTLPRPKGSPGATSLAELLKVAAAVSSAHHFRVAEFPFNLLERGAAMKDAASATLIDTARAAGVVTLANRPLRALTASGPVRLATYNDVGDADASDDPTERKEPFEECVSLIRAQLVRRGIMDDPGEFGIVKFLRESWTSLGDPDLVQELIELRLGAFLSQLYGQSLPSADRECYARFLRCALVNARRLTTSRAIALRRDLVAAGLLPAGEARPLALLACGHCLEAGIDHVLAGMRRPEYVETLRELFHRDCMSAPKAC